MNPGMPVVSPISSSSSLLQMNIIIAPQVTKLRKHLTMKRKKFMTVSRQRS